MKDLLPKLKENNRKTKELVQKLLVQKIKDDKSRAASPVLIPADLYKRDGIK
jgi:hypothetical protein